ncbi:hypothetical protein HRbin15_00841 [bacterium HR15]|nr:hypothetical protein HRbin15_00841 [bacterium HR15]
MQLADLLPKIVNLAEVERIVGKPLRTMDAIHNSGYHLVKARDRDEYYLAKETDLQPLLVRLGDVAEVRFGIKTGANEFFYLEPVNGRVADVIGGKVGATVLVKNGAGWQGEIEAEWLRPVIKSPRELKTLRVRPEDLRYLVFMPPDALRGQLHAPHAWKQRYPLAWSYIQWGEKRGYQHNPTCAARDVWWTLPANLPSDLLWTMTYRERYFVVENAGYYADARLYDSYTDDSIVKTLVNSAWYMLQLEIQARTYGGGGGPVDVKVYEIKESLIPNPAAFTDEQRERLLKAFEQMAEREVKSIFEELGLPKPNRDYSNIRPEEVSLDKVLPDRRALDAVVFEVLGLSEAEQLEVYRAVVELVRTRLVQAQNVLGGG